MNMGSIYIYAGYGRGKSSAAMGRAVQAAAEGGTVVIIQFLKGKGLSDNEFIRRLEPEIKVFHFEKSEENYQTLSEAEKKEEYENIRNGLNFAKKVLTVAECSLLILDEVLGLIDENIITAEDLKSLLENRRETDVILTGYSLGEEIQALADGVSRIDTIK